MSVPFQNANLDAWTFNSKGMFAIGWLELGEPDRALLLLEKCFKNIQGPFQVLEQSADNTGGEGGGGETGSLDADHTSSHRCGANRRTAPGRSTSSLGWGDSCRWCCLVTRGSGQPWQHSEKRNCRTNSSETVDLNFCLSWCQSSEGVPGLLPAPAQRRLRALHPRRELPRPSDGLAAQKGRGLCDPERTARRRCSSSGL